MKFSLLMAALVSFVALSSCSDSGKSNKNTDVTPKEFSGDVIGFVQGHDVRLCPDLAGNFKSVEDNGEVSYVGISQVKNADNSVLIVTKDLTNGRNVETLRVDGQVRQNTNGEIRSYFCVSQGYLTEMIRHEDQAANDITGTYQLDRDSNVVITMTSCQKNTNNCTSTTNKAFRQ